MMSKILRSPVSAIVREHVDAAAHLYENRTMLVHAPHPWLHQIARLDGRIAAHLDGIAVAATAGRASSVAALDLPNAGTVFTATVGAVESLDIALLQRLLAVAQTELSAARGLRSAFGWVSASSLVGVTRRLLDSIDPCWRAIGLSACAMHHANPGTALLRESIRSQDDTLCVRALRCTAALGLTELVADCVALARTATGGKIAFEAARTAVLLGDRAHSLAALDTLVQVGGVVGDNALMWLLRLSEPPQLRTLLRPLHAAGGNTRTLIRAIGIGGDPHFVPWLIERMAEQPLARVAGEAFSLITGADLALLDLERTPPQDDAEPPSDDEIGIDEDDGLPWPDQSRVTHWWGMSAERFTTGCRYFMGQELSIQSVREVLARGRQRQRIAAAEWQCLLQPGTPLFNTAAPAWRQQRWLARMGV